MEIAKSEAKRLLKLEVHCSIDRQEIDDEAYWSLLKVLADEPGQTEGQLRISVRNDLTDFLRREQTQRRYLVLKPRR